MNKICGNTFLLNPGIITNAFLYFPNYNIFFLDIYYNFSFNLSFFIYYFKLIFNLNNPIIFL